MYQWVVWVHLLAAIVWVGGMFFLPLVLVPVLRRRDRSLRAELLDLVGRRFRTVGWIAIGTLLVSGVWNLRNRHLSWETILSADLFDGLWGRILAWKLAFVAAILVLSAVHDFWLGPTSTRVSRDGDARRTEQLRRSASWLGRLNALLALAIIFCASALVRGLPW
jgi:uncharacterized membrane protein